MTSRIRYFILLFSLCLIASCQSSSASLATCESLLPDIPSERINSELLLSTPGNQIEYNINDDLIFLGDNYSQDILIVTPDEDLQVYIWKDINWLKIENKLNYLSVVDRIGPKSPDDPGGQIYDVIYDQSLVKSPTRFCITLRAIKDPENKKIVVASYIEISVSP